MRLDGASCTVADSHAREAIPELAVRFFIGPNVVCRILMAVLTVSLCASFSRGYGSSNYAYAYSSAQIFLPGHGLKMGGVNATADPAQVVKVKSGGNGTDEAIVCNPMGELGDGVTVNPDRKACVSFSVGLPDPQPATAVWLNRHMAFDSIRKRDSRTAAHSVILAFYKQVQRQNVQ